jgi:hypothetical protein
VSKRSDVLPNREFIIRSVHRAIKGGFMRKLSIFLTLIVMLAGVSVQAQKKGISPIGPPVSQVYSIQDQEGGGFMIFDLVSGEFKCNMCEYGYAFSGTGQVKVDGFNVYLSAITESYHIYVSVNVWDRQGKAVMEVYKDPVGGGDIPAIHEYWTDLNMDDNSLDCYAIKK